MATQTRPATREAVDTAGRQRPARPEHRGHFATAAYTRHRRRLDAARQEIADSLHDHAREVRRAARRAQWVAEDTRDELRGRVRQAPLATTGIAFASGMVAAFLGAAVIAFAVRGRAER